MELLDTLPQVVAIAICLIACVTDLRTRRIPNKLTFSAAALAIVFHLAVGGPKAGALSLAGWFVGVALFAPFFIVGGLGAGDLKLIGAVGAWLGPWPALFVALYTAIAGGVLAIIVSLARGYARTAFSNVRFIVTSWRLGVATVPGMTLDESHGPKLAYALPIAVGTGLTIWLR
jgi:prepilin peptidase CpaA